MFSIQPPETSRTKLNRQDAKAPRISTIKTNRQERQARQVNQNKY
jgi:hypothetical protein